jgi:hypothetical protein
MSLLIALWRTASNGNKATDTARCRTGLGTLLVALTGSLCLGACGSSQAQQSDSEAPTYGQLQERELQAERQEFISEKEKELSEIDQEIVKLDNKLAPGRSHPANLSHDLYELKQERTALRGELDRAKTASLSEWRQMRGPIGIMMDSLQAGVSKLGHTMSGVVSSEPKETLAKDSGLCPLEVSESSVAADVDVEREQDRVIVNITSNDPGKVSQLRQKAQQLAGNGNYRPAFALGDQASGTDQRVAQPANQRPQDIRTTLTVQNIDEGVRLSFVPASQQADQLHERLEKDAEALEDGRCENSRMRVSKRNEQQAR